MIGMMFFYAWGQSVMLSGLMLIILLILHPITVGTVKVTLKAMGYLAIVLIPGLNLIWMLNLIGHEFRIIKQQWNC